MVIALAARINVDIATTIPAVRQRDRPTWYAAAALTCVTPGNCGHRVATRARRARMSTVSELLEWSNTGEDRYEARSGQRRYRISKDSSGLPERVWSVVLLGADANGTNEELVTEAWPPTLNDAYLIAQGWEDEYGRWPHSSE